MICSKCEKRISLEGAQFCPHCGSPQEVEKQLPYVGERIDKAVYRLTFAPVEGEFDNEDSAWEAVRHSSWDKDREFGECTVDCMRSLVSPETHPLICGSCGRVVSNTAEGRCMGCGEVSGRGSLRFQKASPGKIARA